MNNKKGVSAIVATVLIILITVAAVTIIWAAIIPMVTDQLDKGSACLEVTSQLSVGGSGYTCLNSTHLNVQVKTGSDVSTLQNLQFLVGEGGTTTSFNLFDAAGTLTEGISGVTTLPGPNSASVYLLDLEILEISAPDSIGIAPMITLGNAIESCDVAATFTPIPACI